MSHPVPPVLNLGQLRGLARDLLRAHRAGDAHASRRIEAAFPGFGSRGTPFRLAHALAVIAREHGFPSWPRLKAHADAAVLRARRRVERRERLQHIAAELVALAERNDAEGLARRPGVGRRDMLAIRDMLRDDGTLGMLAGALVRGLEHRNPRVRAECAHMLDIFGDERCVEPLLRLFDDPVPRVRRFAIHSLVCDDCKAVPLHPSEDVVARIIDHATADASVQVRRHAVTALGLAPDPRATAALQSLAESDVDSAVRRNAQWALRHAGAEPK